MVEGWPRNARLMGVNRERADGRMVATCRIFPTTDWNFGTAARVLRSRRVMASAMPTAFRWVRCTVRDRPSKTKPNSSLDCDQRASPASNFFN